MKKPKSYLDIEVARESYHAKVFIYLPLSLTENLLYMLPVPIRRFLKIFENDIIAETKRGPCRFVLLEDFHVPYK